MTNLKQLLKIKDIKQKEIAIEIGVAQPTVSDWVNGKKYPEGENLTKLAAILDVDPSFILGGSSPNEAHDDAWEIRERLRRDPDLRDLYESIKKAKPEHIKAGAAFFKALESQNVKA